MWNRSSILAGIFSLFILLGCAIVAPHAYAQETTSNQKTSSITTPATVNPGKFAGTWTAHGAFMVISSNGTAVFEARTYSWCGAGVARPCDSIAHNQIRFGYQQHLQLSQISNTTAQGTITSSNDPPASKAFTLTLLPGDTLLYTVDGSSNLLCGPAAAPGTCGA